MKIANPKNENEDNIVISINSIKADADGKITIPDVSADTNGLMTSTDKINLEGVVSTGVYPQLIHPASPIDFDSLVNTGFYFIQKNSVLSNYPGDNPETYGTLQVLADGDNLTQLYCVCGSAGTSIWERNRYLMDNGQLLFTGWRKLLVAQTIVENFGKYGYFKLPGGTIIQYGLVLTSADNTNTTVTLPISYVSQIYSIVASCGLNHIVAVARDGSLSSIRLTIDSPMDGAVINWITIGY